MTNHAIEAAGVKTVYWHRELPPIEASPRSEYTVEASSPHVPGTIAARDELWDRCARALTEEAELRLAQEVNRLGGRCAHVVDERIDVKRDAALNETWLHGRYTYVLYG